MHTGGRSPSNSRGTAWDHEMVHCGRRIKVSKWKAVPGEVGILYTKRGFLPPSVLSPREAAERIPATEKTTFVFFAPCVRKVAQSPESRCSQRRVDRRRGQNYSTHASGTGKPVGENYKNAARKVGHSAQKVVATMCHPSRPGATLFLLIL